MGLFLLGVLVGAILTGLVGVLLVFGYIKDIYDNL